MSYPNTVDEMAARCKILGNPVAVRILGALYGVTSEGKPLQGGVTFMKEKLGLESSESSYILTHLSKAGVLTDATPEKARFKEYYIDPNDGFAVLLGQWACFVSSNSQPQAQAANG